jgi:hypothetical protein
VFSVGVALVVIVIALLLAAAALQFMGRPRVSCWLLVIFPAFLCLAYLRELMQGPQRLGLAAYSSDQEQIIVALGMLAFSIFVAFRTRWPWLFWLEWVLNGIACGMLVYLIFFWKVFS